MHILQVTKMLSIVVILFGICWLPYQTFNFLYGIDVALGWVAFSSESDLFAQPK